MRERWRAVNGYEGLYEVSDQGRVRSVTRHVPNGVGERIVRGRILRSRPDKAGYRIIDLRKGHEVSTAKVHRLVAVALIPNPEHKKQVNHLEENKKWLNCVSNLEWATAKENMNYGTMNERKADRAAKGVNQLTLDGKLVRSWKSTRECGRNGFHQGHVAECCRGEANTHKGYRWEYIG